MLPSDIVITNEAEMLAVIAGFFFAPTEVGDDYVKYDKESLFKIVKTLENAFELWYNVNLTQEYSNPKEKGSE